jgi:hypothetical protein
METESVSAWPDRRWVRVYIGVLAALVIVSILGQLALVWWPALTVLEQVALGGAFVLIAIVGIDRVTMQRLLFSPIALFFKFLEFMAKDEQRPTTGHEQFESGAGDTVVRAVSRSSDGTVLVDNVDKRKQAGPAQPQLDLDLPMIVYGRTGVGKSTFVKARVKQCGLDDQVIAHALSERNKQNEFVDFFESQGTYVLKISSRDSDVRWDPLLDAEDSIIAMENIAIGVFSSREVKVTGWSEGARSMLVAAVVVTKANYGDFAKLEDVIDAGPQYILEEIEDVPNAELVAASLHGLDRDDRDTIYRNLVRRIRPILLSDLCDEELPRISLRDYFSGSTDQAIVLDNVKKDTYAAGFWRFFCESAIEIAREVEGRQQFVLDEVDKLPAIRNLKDLTSAGRSAGVRGVIAAQDAYQLEAQYGDLANSIWANTPNSVLFQPGDEKTAKLATRSLGEVELPKQTTSSTAAGGENTSRSIEVGTPLLTGNLKNLGIGEALIVSPKGWWLCNTAEPEL